jgi:hypothetical protein
LELFHFSDVSIWGGGEKKKILTMAGEILLVDEGRKEQKYFFIHGDVVKDNCHV